MPSAILEPLVDQASAMHLVVKEEILEFYPFVPSSMVVVHQYSILLVVRIERQVALAVKVIVVP